MVSLTISLLYFRKIPIMPLFSGSMVFLFGGLTVYFQQPDFLIFSSSLYFFALAMVIGVFFARKKHLLEHMFGITFAMTKAGWNILSRRWLLALLLAGIGNEIVRFAFTPEFWIQYRFFSILLLAGFAVYQFRLSRQYRIPAESNSWGLRTDPLSTPTLER